MYVIVSPHDLNHKGLISKASERKKGFVLGVVYLPRVKFKRLACKLSGEMKATVVKYWYQLSLNSDLIIILYCLELILF